MARGHGLKKGLKIISVLNQSLWTQPKSLNSTKASELNQSLWNQPKPLNSTKLSELNKWQNDKMIKWQNDKILSYLFISILLMIFAISIWLVQDSRGLDRHSTETLGGFFYTTIHINKEFCRRSIFILVFSPFVFLEMTFLPLCFTFVFSSSSFHPSLFKLFFSHLSFHPRIFSLVFSSSSFHLHLFITYYQQPVTGIPESLNPWIPES